MEHQHLFAAPRFRSGVAIALTDHGIDIDYRSQGCIIETPPQCRDDLWRFVDCLRDGLSTAELAASFDALSDAVPTIIQDLDRLGLLEEMPSQPSGEVMSGDAFFHEVKSFVTRAETRISSSSLYRALRNSSVDKEILIGYVTEYFHLVHESPAIIGQALAHRGTPAAYRILREYFLAECRHDELLFNSLRAVHVDPFRLKQPSPLSSTFAIISSLAVLARQDPLSFKSALFLFERPQPEFHEAFRDCCVSLELPTEFFEPILEHAGLNDEGAHEDISRLLLHEVSTVSREECTNAKKSLYFFLECLELLEQELLHYPQHQQSNS